MTNTTNPREPELVHGTQPSHSPPHPLKTTRVSITHTHQFFGCNSKHSQGTSAGREHPGGTAVIRGAPSPLESPRSARNPRPAQTGSLGPLLRFPRRVPGSATSPKPPAPETQFPFRDATRSCPTDRSIDPNSSARPLSPRAPVLPEGLAARSNFRSALWLRVLCEGRESGPRAPWWSSPSAPPYGDAGCEAALAVSSCGGSQRALGALG